MKTKEFNLSEKKYTDKDMDLSFYPEEDVKEFIRRLKEASKENDWEYAHNDNCEDGFIVISGEEFINTLAGNKLVEDKRK